MAWKFLILVVSMAYFYQPTSGHGRLMEPPSRSSMWRFGYDTPINYDDNQLFCGGFNYQWNKAGGKCGICGDSWFGKRENEAGGKYAKGIITRTYTEGNVMEVKVQITAHHKGWFQFKICPNNDVTKPATQVCLDRHVLPLVNEGGATDGLRYKLPEGSRAGMYTTRLQLPEGLTCEQCVLQWRYHTGNSWDCEPDGHCCTGCGPRQEEFYGCADVRIVPGTQSRTPDLTTGSSFSPTTRPTSSPPSSSSSFPSSSSSSSSPPSSPSSPSSTITLPAVLGKKVCLPVGIWRQVGTMYDWCVTNCNRGHCPSTHCRCREIVVYPTPSEPQTRVDTTGRTSTTTPTTTTEQGSASTRRCFPVGKWEQVAGMNEWCMANCADGYCPSTHCKCDEVVSTVPSELQPRDETTEMVENHRETYPTEDDGNTMSTSKATSQSPGAEVEVTRRTSPTVSPTGVDFQTTRGPTSTKTSAPPSESAGTTESGRCKAIDIWESVPGVKQWCNDNCAAGFCPDFMCSCELSQTTVSTAIPENAEGVSRTASIASRQTTNDVTTTTRSSISQTPTLLPDGHATMTHGEGASTASIASRAATNDVTTATRSSTSQTPTLPGDGHATTTNGDVASASSTAAHARNNYTTTTRSSTTQTPTLPSDEHVTTTRPSDLGPTTGYSTNAANPTRCPSGTFSYVGLNNNTDNGDDFMEFYCQTVCTMGECPEDCVCAETTVSPQEKCFPAPEYGHLPHMDMFCAGLCKVGSCPQQCICI